MGKVSIKTQLRNQVTTKPLGYFWAAILKEERICLEVTSPPRDHFFINLREVTLPKAITNVSENLKNYPIWKTPLKAGI
jgi:hypothetical protein